MTSEIRANTLKNRVGLGTVSFTNTGPVVSGIVTIANSTAEGVTLEDNAGVGNSLKITTPTGYVSVGAGNATFAHLQTDRGIFYFNRRISVDQGIISSYDEDLVLQSPMNTNRVTINKTTGLFSILNDLDVDGHTNLDNVNIAGVTTSTGLVNININASQSVSNPLLLQNSAAAGTGSNPDVVKLAFGSQGSVKASIRADVYGNGAMTFHTNNDTEKLRIGANGEILTAGVASEPLYPHYVTARKVQMEIKGAIDVGQTRHHGSLAVNCTNSNSSIHLVRSDNTQTDGTHIGVLGWVGYDGTDFHQAAAIEVIKGAGAGNNDQPGHMLFKTNEGTNQAAERLRITSDGNLAINKTSAISAKLHIGDASNNGALSQLIKLGNDSSGAGTGSQINMGVAHGNESTSACIAGFLDSDGGTSFIVKTAGTYANASTVGERFRITSGGKIGVGIDPTVRFHLKLSSRTSDFRITDSDSSADVLRAGAQPDGDGLLQLRTTGGAGPVLFDASGSSYITGGNFGVGTVSPTRSLHVKGMASGNSSNRMMIIESTGTSGSFLAFQDANTTDDSKCRIGSIGGNSLGLRGDEHKFQNGAGTDRLHIDSSGRAFLGVSAQGRLCRMHISGDNFPTVSAGGSRVPLIVSNQDGDYGLQLGTYSSGKGFLQATRNDGVASVYDIVMQPAGGNVEISDGNLIFASGHGIDFSATGNSSGTMSSELLDNYEEGTWTPTATGFTINNTYSARYTRIGRICHISCYVQSATGNGTSTQPQIGGLPFTSYGGNTYSYGAGRIGNGGHNNAAYDIAFQQQSGSTNVKFYVGDGGINESMMSGTHVIFSLVYEVA